MTVPSRLSIGILASTGLHLDSFFVRIADLLRAHGHLVHFAAGTPMEHGRSHVVESLTQRPRLVNLGTGGDLRRWAQHVGADVVLVNTATAGLLARRASLPVPVVYFAHGLHWREAGARRTAHWELLERWALPGTASAIVLNAEDHRWFQRWAPDLPVHQLPFGVGLPVDAFQPSPQPDTNVVVWIGEHTTRKRPWLALEVAAELRRRGSPIQLRMLGRGPLTAELTRRAEELGIAADVHLPGFVATAPELQSARLLLHTADWEGLPRVILEAMAVHRPTAAFDVKGVRGLPSVHLAPDRDLGAMSDIIERELAEPTAPDVYPAREDLSDVPVVTTLEAVLSQAVRGDARTAHRA
ncbi:glycosyltransferase family 4 protein [Ornithinimicrobium ciconiae]|uniref:Glycosyltransferase family 4 protein n=1 Tax=Ornithinimicrobium ciconiae TaxID=2594265 RepID=A0A516G635_9MICO|nr:glycosyltransferase family 4 protein [Ornithinimicrobium ciconiae]